MNDSIFNTLDLARTHHSLPIYEPGLRPMSKSGNVINIAFKWNLKTQIFTCKLVKGWLKKKRTRQHFGLMSHLVSLNSRTSRRILQVQKSMCDPKKPESFKTTIYTLVQVLTVIHVYLHLAHVVLCAMRHVSAAARSHRQSILTQHGVVQHPARLRNHSVACWKLLLSPSDQKPPPFKISISWNSHIFLFSSIDTHLISEVRAVLPHYPQVSVGVDSFHLHIAAAF